MQIQGKIAEITRTAAGARFLLRASDGSETRVQTMTVLPESIKEGNLVSITGENPSDPPFLADSVTKIDIPRKRSLLWVKIAIATGVVIAIVVIYLVTRSTGKWEIDATDSGSAAQRVPINLLDANKKFLKALNTDAAGAAVFNGLNDGVYYAQGPGAGSPMIMGSISKTSAGLHSTLPVASPFTLLVRVTSCYAGIPNNGLRLTTPTHGAILGVTDSNGEYAFVNLEAGTYSVTGNYTATNTPITASATLSGITLPAAVTLQSRPPGSSTCLPPLWSLRFRQRVQFAAH